MSALDTNRVYGGTNSFGFIARIAAAIGAWNEARITRRELNNLTDRELEDIGLLRSDIDAITLSR